MIDNRFPNLTPVPRGPLEAVEREVRMRTGAKTALNSNGYLYIYWENAEVGVLQERAMHNGSVRRFTPQEIDVIVAKCWSARVSRSLKDALMNGVKRDRKAAQDQEFYANIEDGKRGALDRLKHHRNRVGMGKHFRGSAVVSGLKE